MASPVEQFACRSSKLEHLCILKIINKKKN